MPSSHWGDVKRRFDISEVKVATWRDPSLSIHPSRDRPGVMRTISAADAAKSYVPTYKYKIELPKPPEPTDDEMSVAEKHQSKYEVDHDPAAADVIEASIDDTDIVSLLAVDAAPETSAELDIVDVLGGTAPGADAEAMAKSVATEEKHIASPEEDIEVIPEHNFADVATDSEVQVDDVPSVEPTVDNNVLQDPMDSALAKITSSDSVADIIEGDLRHENLQGLPPDHLDPITEAMLQRLLDEPPPSSAYLAGNIDLEALLAGTPPAVLATDIPKDFDIGETSETSDKRVSFAPGTPEPKPTVRKKKSSTGSKTKKKKKVTAAQIEELPDDIVAILDETIEPVARTPFDPAAIEAAMIDPLDDVFVHVVDVGGSELVARNRSSEILMVDPARNAGVSELDPTQQSIDDILYGLVIPPAAPLPPMTEVPSPSKMKSKSSKLKTSTSRSKTQEGKASKSKHKTEVPIDPKVAGLGIDMTPDVIVPLTATAAVIDGHDYQEDTLPNLTDKELQDILSHTHDMKPTAATVIEPKPALESSLDAVESAVSPGRDEFDSQIDDGLPELKGNLQPLLVDDCKAIETGESQHDDIEGTAAITGEDAVDAVATEKDKHGELSSDILAVVPANLDSCVDTFDEGGTAQDDLGEPVIPEQDAQPASENSILPDDIDAKNIVSNTATADFDADPTTLTTPDPLTLELDGIFASESPAERIDDLDFDFDDITGVDIAGEEMGEVKLSGQDATASALDNDMLANARELSPVLEPLPDSDVADIDVVGGSELQELDTQGEVDRDGQNTILDGDAPSAMTADISALDDLLNDPGAGLPKNVDLVPTDLPKGSLDDMNTPAEDANAAEQPQNVLDEQIPTAIDSQALATELDLEPLTSIPTVLSADPRQDSMVVDEGSARVPEEASMLAQEASPVVDPAAAAAVAAITAIVADAPPSPTLSRSSKRRSDGWSRPVKKPGDSAAPGKSDSGRASKRSSRSAKSGSDPKASSRRYAVSAEEEEERRRRRRARKEEEAAKAREEQLRREEEDEERRLRHDARRAARKAAIKEAEESARRIAREEAEAEAKREADSRRQRRERRDSVVGKIRDGKFMRQDSSDKARPTLLKAFSVTSGSSRTNAGLLIRTSSDAPRSPTLRRSATDSTAPRSTRDDNASRPTSKRTSTRSQHKEGKVDDTPAAQIEDVAVPLSPESTKSHRSHRSRDEDGDRRSERPHRSGRDSERRERRPTLDSQSKKPSFMGSFVRAFK